jgi:SET domain-containing protein
VRWTIDGTGRGNLARYVNHSCRPNCEAIVRGKRVLIYAKRAVAAGEELVYDYGKAYFEEFIQPKGCACAHCAARQAGVVPALKLGARC